MQKLISLCLNARLLGSSNDVPMINPDHLAREAEKTQTYGASELFSCSAGALTQKSRDILKKQQ